MADPDNIPAAAPWYKSAVLRGILVVLFTQVLARLATHFHLDSATLTALGINPDALAQMTLDGISAAALAYAAHGRVVKPLPQVTLTQKQADLVNKGSTNAPPTSPPAS